MKKKNFLRSFIANAMALVALVLSLTFASCGDEDDFLNTTGTEIPGGNDKPSDPSWKVVAVDGTNCTATGIEWKSSENVSLSRAYADADMEGFANAVVSHKYTAQIEYTDVNKTQGNIFKSESKTYTSSLMARLYGLKSAMVFDSGEALDAATGEVKKISDEQGYELFAINFGGSRQVIVKNSVTLSTNSLAFEGVSKTDLCSASFSAPVYDSKSYNQVTSDKEGYDKYEMAVKVKLTAEEAGSDNVRYLVFKVANVYVKTSDNNGDDKPIGPTEKELVGYAIRNNQFVDGATKGDIVKIYDDLSEEKVGSFNVGLNHSTVTPEDVTQDGLSSLAWEQGETTSVELAATGNTRSVNVEADCKVAITEVFTSVTNRSKVPMTFKGLYETARIMFPDGTSADLLVGAYEMSDGTVEAIASSETSVTIQHSAYAKFNGETPVELKANVVLNKASDPEVKESEVTILIENFEVRDENYIFDVVQYWTIAEPTRTSISLPHNASMWAEDEKATTSRNYNTTTPTMESVSSTDYTKNVTGTKGNFNISGKVTTYSSDFVFESVNIEVGSKFLNYFEITSAEGHKAIWDIKTSVIKTGVTMGTQDLGDETKHVYSDKVHFALPINSVNVATCEQSLVYTEEITPSEPEKDPVTDVDYREKSNTLETIKGIPTGVLVITIIDSEGGERDTTIYRPYPKAGVQFGGIADFTSEDNTFTLPEISNNGRASTEVDGDVTYSIQKKVAKSNKFEEGITVINGSSKNLSLGGKTFTFKSTNFDVNVVDKGQAENSTFTEGYDVWASEVVYDVHTTKFNILVERAPVYVEVEADQILSGAITITVDKNTTPMLSLVISCKNKTIIYSSAYDFKNPSNTVDMSVTPVEHAAFNFKNVPSATLNGTGSDRVPANLIVAKDQWAYYANSYTRLFSAADVLTTGCKNPIIAIGEVQSDGSLKIKNGNDTLIFKVK